MWKGILCPNPRRKQGFFIVVTLGEKKHGFSSFIGLDSNLDFSMDFVASLSPNLLGLLLELRSRKLEGL